MTLPAWHEEPITKSHDRRSAFDCGDEALNEFLWRHARKTHISGGAKTFLAVENSDVRKILGFYSIAPASVTYEKTPEVIKRGLARHEVPVFRLGRLAVDRSVPGRSMGGQLLLAVARRCLLSLVVACLLLHRLAVLLFSSMRRMIWLHSGMPAMGQCRCLMHRFHFFCRSKLSMRPLFQQGNFEKLICGIRSAST